MTDSLETWAAGLAHVWILSLVNLGSQDLPLNLDLESLKATASGPPNLSATEFRDSG